jgi:ABC-type phosphate transport system substrate-binding protein
MTIAIGKGAGMNRSSVGSGVIARLLGLSLLALAVLLALYAQSASAIGGGQIGTSFGTPGVGNGQFFNPAMFGADPVDGTLYTGDYNGVVETKTSNFRIQQLSPSGEFKASAEIVRYQEEAKKIRGLQGIAVDHGLGRVYVVESCRVSTTTSGSQACKESGGQFGALKVLVYSTTPEGTTLKALAPIALPSGAQEIYEVRAIAVDPSNNDIVLLAQDFAKHKIVQRISSAGVLGARYTDTAEQLKPAPTTAYANSLAVSPSGVSYTVTGSAAPGTTNTKVWQLPASLASLEEVPGVAAAAAKENWPLGHYGAVEANFGGPQLAISADGSTLYWKEIWENSTEKEPGDFNIRAYSLSKGETVGIWGGGSTKCKTQTQSAALAATSGGNLAVFDFGAVTAKTTDVPAYGLKISTFGPSGSGCAEPVAKFTVNGKPMNEEPTGIKPGDTVSFNASSSELLGGFRKQLVWKFGDGTEQVVGEPSEGVEAPATVSHVYTSAAKVTPKLEVKLSLPRFGNPVPVERTFTVGTITGFKLKVKKGGTGSGLVTSSPAGINCGTTCEAEFESGKEVTLTATADPGSQFSGWSGAGCSGTDTCKVTMTAAQEVTANFALEQHLLKVTKSGSGGGTVTSSPAGINCGVTCEAAFNHGTEVTLTAVADGSSEFKGWSGAGCSGTGTCKVTMTAAKEVNAEFAPVAVPKFTLKVKRAGTGTGTVTSSPAGITCGATCEAEFESGKAVTLSATPGPNTKPVAWSGCDEIVGANECKVTMTAAKEVIATFALEQHQLKVTKSGPGGGVVTSSPAGISCGTTCAANFDHGTEVTLTATADGSSEFKGWSGAGCSGTGTCKVTMTAAKEVNAEFATATKFTLKVTKTGIGSGPVTSSPVGIDCRSICQASFTAGTSVTLSAVLNEGTKELVWSGCDEIVGANECKVTLTSNREVTPFFNGISCTGGNITGAGSSLQGLAHTAVWKPAFEGSVCNEGTFPTVSYEPVGSGKGMAEWNYDGAKGSINTGLSFIGTDDAPSKTQIEAIKSKAGGAQLAVVPVTQTAIAIVANLPEGCELEGITNTSLVAVMEGRVSNWSKVEGTEGTCNSAITRVVRKDASGTTYQFKNYLFKLYNKGLFCTTGATEGKATWQDLEAFETPNVSWPESCPAKALSTVVRPAANGGGELVKKVNATDGSIGYAALPDAVNDKDANTVILSLQNNGQKKGGEANFADPNSGTVANCGGMTYQVPSPIGARRDVDWSGVFGAKPAIGGESYPLCALTYALAFHGYQAAGFTQAQETTVRDYLYGYVVQPTGQEDINSNYYAALPTAAQPAYDVLGAARNAAASISW